MAIQSLLLAALLAAANAQMTTLTLSADSLTSVVSLPAWPSPRTTTTATETDTIFSGMTTKTTYITPFLPAATSTTTTTANMTATVVSSTTTSMGSGAAESSAYSSSVLSVETYTPTPVGGANATGTGAPSQYTGAAARKDETKGSAWIAMVVFGVVGLVVL